MWNDLPPGRNDRGFTLVELLVVVAIIVILAAISLPQLTGALRNYRIAGAARQITSDLQSARGKAIMTNTNNGVSFVVVDFNSYRLVQEDLAASEQLMPLLDLPAGVSFVALAAGTSGATGSVRFNRLGSFCSPGGSCGAAVSGVCTSQETAAKRCTTGVGSLYFAPVTARPGYVSVTLLEETTGLSRVVQIAPGGSVATRR
jgi:prepilin-type N-terminal cleavage/methylation domain-containing protein